MEPLTFLNIVYSSSLYKPISFILCCLKNKTLYNLLSSSSFLDHFSRIMGNSEQKKYLADLWTADIIQLFIAVKGNLSGLIFFECRGITQRPIDKCSLLFICILLSYTLSNGQKPAQNLILELIALCP